MTHYINKGAGPVRAVEVISAPDTIEAFIQLRSAADTAPVEAQLAKLGRTVISHTTVDGKPMLVTSGPRNETQFIDQLSSHYGRLTEHTEKKPFDAWKVRSILGFGGQGLQLASSLMKKKPDLPLLLFAGTNLTANGINLAYKAQKRDDPHQLRLLKQEINADLAPHLAKDAQLLDVDDTRAVLRERNKPKAVEPLDDFMRKNSVNVGELGLRYIGALGMAFPPKYWKKALVERRLPMTDIDAPLRTKAGLGSILGKTIAVTSLVADPYNTEKKHTWLDGVREKYSFLAGGLVEAAAFSALTYDALKNTVPVEGRLDNPRSLKIGGKYYRDWLSAIGGAMFVSGYIVRSWAKFGERQVNMPELYAHASDTLALLPPAEIPQKLADVSAHLADHFKKTPGLSFNVIYTKLSDDLARSHQIIISRTAPQQQPEVAPVLSLEPTVAGPTSQIDVANAVHVAPERNMARSA